MAYRFNHNEPIATAIRRISVEQIDKALMQLEAPSYGAPAVHDARKALKRIRSLLYLIEASLTDKLFRHENARFRDIGRTLSGARDIHVMRQTLTLLQAVDARSASSASMTEIKEQLTQKAEKLHGGKAVRVKAVEDLYAARKIFADVPLKKPCFSTLEAGLEATYSKSRAAMKKAYRSGKDEHFHNWRKHVQRHWRHIKLLSSAWPELCEARVNSCQALSERLGTHNDIDVLEEFIRSHIAAEENQTPPTSFLDLCQKQKAQYRKIARPFGERLFNEPAASFVRRFSVYWKTSTQIEKAAASPVKLKNAGAPIETLPNPTGT